MTRVEALAAELRRYRAADELEMAHHRGVLELLGAGEPSFLRGSFEPGHITASLFIVDANWRLLLHRHKRLGRWLQMGGHVEPGETTLEAALREGSEESGLADLEIVGGVIDVDVHAIPAGKGEPDHRHFDVRYVARTRTPETITIDPAESEALAWFHLADAESAMNEAASTRVIRKIGMLRGERTLNV